MKRDMTGRSLFVVRALSVWEVLRLAWKSRNRKERQWPCPLLDRRYVGWWFMETSPTRFVLSPGKPGSMPLYKPGNQGLDPDNFMLNSLLSLAGDHLPTYFPRGKQSASKFFIYSKSRSQENLSPVPPDSTNRAGSGLHRPARAQSR